jgi:site-specific recombinase XerD
MKSNELVSLPSAGIVWFDDAIQDIQINKNKDYWTNINVKAEVEKDTDYVRNKKERLSLNIEKELTIFLDSRNSKLTSKNYKIHIKFFFDYCKTNQLDTRLLKRQDVLQYIIWLRDFGYSNNKTKGWFSTKLISISSFYTFLQRNTEGLIMNYFLGNGIKYEEKVQELKELPTAEDIQTLISNCSKKTALAIRIMSETALRIGAMEKLVISNTKNRGYVYQSYSKGKIVTGNISNELVDFIGHTGKVFKDWTIKDYSKAQKEIIKNKKKYNLCFGSLAHSFRHYAACKLYEETKDIMKVKKLLNHLDVSVTQKYLERLGQSLDDV